MPVLLVVVRVLTQVNRAELQDPEGRLVTVHARGAAGRFGPVDGLRLGRLGVARGSDRPQREECCGHGQLADVAHSGWGRHCDLRTRS